MAWLLLGVASNVLAESIPELRYEPPQNFYHSAIHPPEDYTSNEFNASLQVYPFRSFSGNIEQQFQRTLLRDWIDPMHREEKVAGNPAFGRIAIPGADAAYTAQFADSPVGLPKPHMRMLVVAGQRAAIVDASAGTVQSWQRAIPVLNQFAGTLRVAAGPDLPSVADGPGPAGAAIAGLYMGTKPKYVVDLNRPVGYGHHVPALHFYLFSADGRVYRAYDMLNVAGGDPARFDFEAARRSDPVNSGRYAVKGSSMTLRMGEQLSEIITVPALQGGRVTIETVIYVRQ
ncbi:MAG TPA: hypothetical protein VHB46_19160 [Burkholderiales bacterium]|nr:hypothetical protein [Burkholderiales bacterium]